MRVPVMFTPSWYLLNCHGHCWEFLSTVTKGVVRRIVCHFYLPPLSFFVLEIVLVRFCRPDSFADTHMNSVKVLMCVCDNVWVVKQACDWYEMPPPPVVIVLTCIQHIQHPLLAIACISGSWKAPLEQSATRCHLSSNADCFSGPPQNLPFFLIISFLTVFGSWFCTPCIVVV